MPLKEEILDPSEQHDIASKGQEWLQDGIGYQLRSVDAPNNKRTQRQPKMSVFCL